MNDICIYVEKDCIYCKILKKYLISNNIAFNEIDINRAPQYIQDINLIPITRINSNIIIGVNLPVINKNLGINKNLSSKPIYLDHASTTYLKKEVFEEMKPYLLKKFVNASSIYSLGLENREVIENARNKVAQALSCNNGEVFFTSGGSESNNTAIKGIAFANKDKGNHIITTSIEHPSVLNTCRYLEKHGFNITYLPVDKYGIVSLDYLRKSITCKTILISVMFANNEIGTLQPIEEIGKIAKENNIYFHTDAVQAIGNIPINLEKSHIDILSLSAHKFYGPKGIGALYIKKGTSIDPLIHGGSQENSMRAGTENLANIVGLGKAIELATSDINKYNKKLLYLRSKFIKDLLATIPNIKLNGHPKYRLPGNVNISFNNIDSEILKYFLDVENIYVSTTSACSEKNLNLSHVLKAIGLSDEEARSSLRFTLGESNTEEDINYTIRKINNIIKELNNIV
ncbi:IscS subfamily cysteine desulfurase [uncultured Clostridium sp.]|uniref:IscS subfamily cysteine desulfurase n=1 Tax=uncultured Clostridium sp. TaxID=59620 RepID=UPI0025874673|nr:IscS subfamily cysteine desulfurase [uncultured Clostridium sp.]MDU1351045.1 IscS subfamily cysteine desulfurase [Clostridium argentinense]